MAMSDLLGLVGGSPGALSALAGPIEIRTNLNASNPLLLYPLDPVTGAPSGQPQGNGVLHWLVKALQPQISVRSIAGEMSVAPAGAPTHDYMPAAIFGAGVGIAGLLAAGAALGKILSPLTVIGVAAAAGGAAYLVRSPTP